jgi:hypothetical protein
MRFLILAVDGPAMLVVNATGNALNVWSAALSQAKGGSDGLVCANVSVNKGEGVVKGKDVLSAA